MRQAAEEKAVQELGDSDREVINFYGLALEGIAPRVQAALEALPLVTSLSLVGCQLSSLEHFPRLPALVFLFLNGNLITDGELSHLAGLVSLQCLDLSDNVIEQMEALKQLQALPDLIQLSLRGNPVERRPDYRAWAFKALPGLQLLDDLDSLGDSFEYTASEIDQQVDAALQSEEEDVGASADGRALSTLSSPHSQESSSEEAESRDSPAASAAGMRKRLRRNGPDNEASSSNESEEADDY